MFCSIDLIKTDINRCKCQQNIFKEYFYLTIAELKDLNIILENQINMNNKRLSFFFFFFSTNIKTELVQPRSYYCNYKQVSVQDCNKFKNEKRKEKKRKSLSQTTTWSFGLDFFLKVKSGFRNFYLSINKLAFHTMLTCWKPENTIMRLNSSRRS